MNRALPTSVVLAAEACCEGRTDPLIQSLSCLGELEICPLIVVLTVAASLDLTRSYPTRTLAFDVRAWKWSAEIASLERKRSDLLQTPASFEFVRSVCILLEVERILDCLQA